MRTALTLILVVLLNASLSFAKNRQDVAPTGGSRGLLDCSQAVSIACTDQLAGSNAGSPSHVEFYSCSGWQEPFGEKVYKLTLPGPGWSSVLATLVDSGCDLDIFLLGSCDESDCIAYGDESAYATGVPPGDYYIVVDGYSGECNFTLSVECHPVDPPCCPVSSFCYDFDFSASPNGFWTVDCGGAPTWSWGQSQWTGSVGCDGVEITNLLCTSPGTEYPNDAGEAAVIGPVAVTELCSCLELCHAFYIEEDYDGGIVKVSYDQGGTWETVAPAHGYGFPTNEDTKCIPLEAAFANEDGSPWEHDCFDLSSYVGMQIWIGFFFGSDSSVTYPGWVIHWARLGRAQTSVAPSSWGSIKAIYR